MQICASAAAMSPQKLRAAHISLGMRSRVARAFRSGDIANHDRISEKNLEMEWTTECWCQRKYRVSYLLRLQRHVAACIRALSHRQHLHWNSCSAFNWNYQIVIMWTLRMLLNDRRIPSAKRLRLRLAWTSYKIEFTKDQNVHVSACFVLCRISRRRFEHNRKDKIVESLEYKTKNPISLFVCSFVRSLSIEWACVLIWFHYILLALNACSAAFELAVAAQYALFLETTIKHWVRTAHIRRPVSTEHTAANWFRFEEEQISNTFINKINVTRTASSVHAATHTYRIGVCFAYIYVEYIDVRRIEERNK